MSDFKHFRVWVTAGLYRCYEANSIEIEDGVLILKKHGPGIQPCKVACFTSGNWHNVEEIDAATAAAFKNYVHGRLTAAGVPDDPKPDQNKATGCRIGGRLDWLLEKLEQHSEAFGYASRLFKHFAPQCEPLPTLPGIISQLDNLLAGMSQRAVLPEGMFDVAPAVEPVAGCAPVGGSVRDSHAAAGIPAEIASQVAAETIRYKRRMPTRAEYEDAVAKAEFPPIISATWDESPRDILADIAAVRARINSQTGYDPAPNHPGRRAWYRVTSSGKKNGNLICSPRYCCRGHWREDEAVVKSGIKEPPFSEVYCDDYDECGKEIELAGFSYERFPAPIYSPAVEQAREPTRGELAREILNRLNLPRGVMRPAGFEQAEFVGFDEMIPCGVLDKFLAGKLPASIHVRSASAPGGQGHEWKKPADAGGGVWYIDREGVRRNA